VAFDVTHITFQKNDAEMVRVLAFDCSDHFASNEIERGSKVVNDISNDCAKVLWRKHNVQVKGL
jgi:hypothetical protein